MIDHDLAVGALKNKGADGPCPRCSSTSWGVFDEYVYLGITPDAESVEHRRQVQTVAAICQGCGYVSACTWQGCSAWPERPVVAVDPPRPDRHERSILATYSEGSHRQVVTG